MKILSLAIISLFLSILCNGQPKAVKSKSYKNKVLNKVEVEASFPGGDQGWRRFLEKTLNANIPVEYGAPRGSYTVRIQFIVSKDGTVSNVAPLTNYGYGMEQECIRTIKKSGKWTPAIQNKKRVNAYRIQPITFQIADE